MLSLFVAPDKFQRVLMARINPGSVAAIVDREGKFLARSLDYRDRVGTPATIYVRNAVKRGGKGFYEGRTFEGLENYSAFSTSPLTGWSAHVAIDRTSIDGPQSRSAWAIVLALLAALLLAIALMLFAAHDARLRRRDQAKILKLQKSEVIAQFTSIVVHDMRNLLAASYSGLGLIEKRAAESETRRNVERVRDVVRRGEKLINRLLSFARTGSQEIGAVDLLLVLEGVEDLLRQILGEGITLSWSISPDARHIFGNADQLELALINLAKNAHDAMENRARSRSKFREPVTWPKSLSTMMVLAFPRRSATMLSTRSLQRKSAAREPVSGLRKSQGPCVRQGSDLFGTKCGGGARFRILLPLAPESASETV